MELNVKSGARRWGGGGVGGGGLQNVFPSYCSMEKRKPEKSNHPGNAIIDLSTYRSFLPLGLSCAFAIFFKV